jgi:hypothetical protein
VTPVTRVVRAGAVLAAALVFAFGVAAPPERCPTVTPAQLRQSEQSAVDWFALNQHADGTWLYLYDAEKDTAAPEYNVVRHTGAVMGLYQAAAAGLPRALAAADRGTDWARDRLTIRDNWSAVFFGDEVPTGASALLAAGLSIRRDATGDRRYDALLRRLGRFLVEQTEPSGAVLAQYDPAHDRPMPGEYSKYYTGEAYWALARLHRDFPDEGWGKVADRIGAYLATKRDDAEDHWPPIEDHWAAYGLSETARFPERGRPPLTGDELGYARSQAKLFGSETRWISERMGPWGGVVRGPHEPRGGGYGVMAEGLTGLWRTAGADPRMADLRPPLAERAMCIAGLAIDAQSTAEDAADAKNPGRVEGAWFRDGETRMDDQQHALAGLLRTTAVARAGAPGSPAPDDETPSTWLSGLVIVLALNPVRAVAGLPGGASRTTVLLGAAAGALLVIGAAALGPPLLDALDVSDPSFRAAAGLIAVGAGIADLFRPRAALAPIAFPLVARPALLVIAIGAGADRGIAPAAAGMAVGVAALAALAEMDASERARSRTLSWSARIVAAGLVAGGALTALAGILDV